ncbi:MAG: GSCFA domain-containing protein [Bacteroidales bacterium]|nr:GSCFA domain-containing protein [Bacteroidales bacterium]
MIKLNTPVLTPQLPVQLSLGDRIMVLGSCFADSMGSRLSAAGFNVCVNPFGTLYNPVSICNSVARLASGRPFAATDCVEMGAGAGLVCSWSHHTSFARPTAEEFLSVANSALEEASAFWKTANKVLITLGSAMVWKLVEDGEVVSNCLKRPSAEFSHEMLGVQQIAVLLKMLVEGNPGKEFIFTVSPIRHLGDGAHANTLSKATLHLALARVMEQLSGAACYFPAYEILLDELRDYRYFAEDLVHPSRVAEDIIWERFVAAAVVPGDQSQTALNEKAARQSAHRPLR